jgi:hypothetical protein
MADAAGQAPGLFDAQFALYFPKCLTDPSRVHGAVVLEAEMVLACVRS